MHSSFPIASAHIISDAATGFTLCEGSVTLNNRCLKAYRGFPGSSLYASTIAWMSRSDGESGRGATGAIWVVICPPPPPSKPNGDGAGVACCWNPKGEGEGLAPNAGVEEGAPNAEVDEGVPKADSPPNAGAEDAAPNAGVDDGAPNAGVEDGVPKAGVDDGVPKAGVDGVAPNAGVEEGVPKDGVVEGVPKDGAPKRGEEEGVPNMAAAVAEIAGGGV